MSDLIWLHEDALRTGHRLFDAAQAHKTERACFIWDDAYFAAMHYGLKRRVFLYESLVELPVDIYQGQTVATLLALARQNEASRILTGKTPNPHLRSFCEELRDTVPVSTIADKAFVQMDAPPELKRFFKYWNKAKKNAFLPDGRPGQ